MPALLVAQNMVLRLVADLLEMWQPVERRSTRGSYPTQSRWTDRMNQREVYVSPSGERISFPAPASPIDQEAARRVWASALCAEVDPELFAEDRGSSATDAKNICATCSVRALCLTTFGEAIEYGVVGGLTGRERRAMRRRRQGERAA